MMSNTLFTPLLLTTCCALVTGQAAATSVALTGSIEPTTCSLTLGSAASHGFDYGDISYDSLSASARTALVVKTVALKVTCDAPTRVAIGAVNNKADTNPFTDGTLNMSGAGGPAAGQAKDLFGLGSDGSVRMGGYSLALVPSTMKVDGVASAVVSSSNRGTAWATVTDGFIGGATAPGYWRGWAKNGGRVPLAGTSFEADLAVQPWIDAKSKLNLTSGIKLDGAATIELHYL